MGQFEKFVAWQWKWLDTPRLFLLATIPALALSAIAFRLRYVNWGADVQISVILGCLIIFPLIGALLMQAHKWYEKRAITDKQEFAIVFGRFSADIAAPSIHAIVQLRIDSILMQLAYIIGHAGKDEGADATEAFENARRLAKRCDFGVMDSYEEYL